MGFLETIFGKREPAQAREAKDTFRMLTGYEPVFSSWSGGVFESELIRSALDAHGRHAAKLQPQFTRKDSLASRLTIAPNSWQTWAGFLYQLAVVLYARNTAFIVPTIGEHRETTGISVIAPDRWEVVQNNGVVYIRFHFTDGKKRAVELDKIGIMTRFQFRNELFGETNDALKATLDLIQIQQDGIKEGVKNSATYRFTAVSSNWSKDEDLAKESERFARENFRRGKGGVLIFPNTYKDVKQVTNTQFTVDKGQMDIIKQNVFDYFSVNEDVIQNKAYGDSWLAFYEGAIEWFALCASETISRMLYTERERKLGAGVFFTANRLQYMSNADKLAAISQMADRGLMTRNELREILNLAPLPAPYGDTIPARGEYYNVNEENKNANETE